MVYLKPTLIFPNSCLVVVLRGRLCRHCFGLAFKFFRLLSSVVRAFAQGVNIISWP